MPVLAKIDKSKREPATVTARVPAEMIEALDAWIADQPDPKPSRPEAICTGLGAWLTYYRLDKNRPAPPPRSVGRSKKRLF